MLDFVVQELAGSADWRTVLEDYERREKERKQANPDADGWLPRVTCVEGVEPTHLSQLHGKLIALGFLKFELLGKTGMHYQLAPLGRQALEQGLRAGRDAVSAAEPVDELALEPAKE